jgi:monofunctional glycosyltransferase
MALALDEFWSKARTIEIYLNIAEWGDGLCGIEAAA